ncbi:hypothetical protein [Vagococcus silagei]|uniref:HTH cro/C1-type domain-containing protein n=1 Tax=Vagococcus silagei TaxID=2508885 RepID=A0A4S3B435_9ENTE|nr:hypothetical protein [Vagococcus silagei]THB61228.1 hypothetical protein ESZ54_05645 [Vagococcus silagei]
MSIDKQSVGLRISKIRKNLKDSKTSMAAFGKLLTPVADRSLVARWEKGINLPNEDRLHQIASLGGVSTDYLLFGKQLNGYGNKIRSLRKNELRITKLEFSRIFRNTGDVTENTVSDWENENLLPTKRQLEMIVSMASTTIDELLWNEESNPVIESVKESEEKIKELNLDYLQKGMNEFLTDRFLHIKLKTIKNENLSEIFRDILDSIIEGLNVDKTTSEDKKSELIKTLTEEYNQLLNERIK